MEKAKVKTVNLSRTLDGAMIEEHTNKKLESENLGFYVLITTLASIGGGLTFWIIFFKGLQLIN